MLEEYVMGELSSARSYAEVGDFLEMCRVLSDAKVLSEIAEVDFSRHEREILDVYYSGEIFRKTDEACLAARKHGVCDVVIDYCKRIRYYGRRLGVNVESQVGLVYGSAVG